MSKSRDAKKDAKKKPTKTAKEKKGKIGYFSNFPKDFI
jgi:hypothetical protein